MHPSADHITFVDDGRELVTVVDTLIHARGPLGVPRRPIMVQRCNVATRRSLDRAWPILANTAAVSPDGRVLATALDREIQLWDLATKTKIGTLLKCRYRIRNLKFTADGRTLCSTTTRGTREATRVTYYQMGAGLARGKRGLQITKVLSGSPAKAAGLQEDDIVLQIGEQKVNTVAELRQQLDLDAGQGIELTLLRNGHAKTIRLRPAPWPRDNLREQLDAVAGLVRLWNIETGTEIGELPIPLEGEAGPPGTRENTASPLSAQMGERSSRAASSSGGPNCDFSRPKVAGR